MRKREKMFLIRVTEKEYETIVNNATKNNLQVAPYIRMVAQNPIIKEDNYDIILQHTKQIAEIRNSINRLIFTIEATNNYLPQEIDDIVEMITLIFETENKLLKDLRKDRI